MEHFKKSNYKLSKQILLIIPIIIALFSGLSMPTFANSDEPALAAMQTTVRVAYYELDGFFEYDDLGKETGYGVEVLNKIAQYTSLNFEYVKAESWSSTKQMILENKADFRMPATMPVNPSTELSYNGVSIIDTYQVILTNSNRDDLYYQDYEKIKTLKIALTTSFYNNTQVKSYFDEIGIREEQLVFTSDFNESYELMKNLEVDALATNIMDLDDSMKMLARFNNISNYIAAIKDNPILTVVDNALAQIKLDEPLFFSKTYAKWFPKRTTTPLSKEEIEFLKISENIIFVFRDDEGYLQHFQNNEFSGIFVETVKAVCTKLNIPFNSVSSQDSLSLPDENTYKVYSGFFYDVKYGAQWHLSLSKPIDDITYYIIQKKGEVIDDSNCKVAAVAQFKYTDDYLKNKYREDQLVYYETYEECIKAVKNGKADVTIINNYIAEYYLEMYQYSGLSAYLTSEYSHLYSFAVSNECDILASILSKTVASFTDEELKQINLRGQSTKPENNVWEAIIYKNPIEFSLFVAGILAVIIVLTLLLIFIKHNKKKNLLLEKALSAKTDFLDRMSHDMRTPLNAVLSFSRLSKDELDKPNMVADNLSKIESSGEYLLGLINEILDASKIESGKLELREEIVNGPEFLNNIGEEFKTQAKTKGVILITDLGKANTKWVIMDKLRTRQIYSNLLNNAIKFSNPGSTIEWYMKDTSIDEKHMTFISTITDHGCGMSKEFMDHMFEPFTQERLSKTNIQEGTGLGLSIVKKLLELSGGSIEVSSELGKGTTFTLHMSRKIPSQEEIAQMSQNTKETDKSVLFGKRVLIVEDHPLNREIVIRLLNKVGVECETAENGQIGIDKFVNASGGYYDAILMDVRMPVMDGLEASKIIRKMSRDDAKTIPIISMTANAYDNDKLVCIEAGMNDYIPKPIDIKLLYEKLIKYIVNKNDN